MAPPHPLPPPRGGRVGEGVNSDWRQRWKNINVWSVLIFTILKRAMPMGISPPTHPFINSLTVGSAPYAALLKICLKRFKERPYFNEISSIQFCLPSVSKLYLYSFSVVTIIHVNSSSLTSNIKDIRFCVKHARLRDRNIMDDGVQVGQLTK